MTPRQSKSGHSFSKGGLRRTEEEDSDKWVTRLDQSRLSLQNVPSWFLVHFVSVPCLSPFAFALLAMCFFFKWLSFHSKEIKDCATCWTDLQLKQCFSILSKRDDDTSNSNCLQGNVIFMPAWLWRHFCLEMFSCFPPNTPSRPWATSLLEVKSTHGYVLWNYITPASIKILGISGGMFLWF